MTYLVETLPPMPETWIRSLGQEDPLEKEVATHSSVLAWRIPWTEPGRLQSLGAQRVKHNWVTTPSLSHGNTENSNPYPLEGEREYVPYSNQWNGGNWHMSLPGQWFQFPLFSFPAIAHPEALDKKGVYDGLGGPVSLGLGNRAFHASDLGV